MFILIVQSLSIFWSFHANKFANIYIMVLDVILSSFFYRSCAGRHFGGFAALRNRNTASHPFDRPFITGCCLFPSTPVPQFLNNFQREQETIMYCWYIRQHFVVRFWSLLADRELEASLDLDKRFANQSDFFQNHLFSHSPFLIFFLLVLTSSFLLSFPF